MMIIMTYFYVNDSLDVRSFYRALKRYWKIEEDGLAWPAGRPYARPHPNPSCRSANWTWSQSSKTSLTCRFSNSHLTCPRQDEDSTSIAPSAVWPNCPPVKGRRRISSSIVHLYRVGVTFDTVLNGKELETKQDRVKKRSYTFEVPLSVLKVTKMFMFLYYYVFDQWYYIAALLGTARHWCDERTCFRLLLFLILEQLVGNHEGIILSLLDRFPHLVVGLCDGFRVCVALDLFKDFLVYLRGSYLFDLINKGNSGINRDVGTNPRVIFYLMNPNPIEGIDLQHPSNEIPSHRIDAIGDGVISSWMSTKVL